MKLAGGRWEGDNVEWRALKRLLEHAELINEEGGSSSNEGPTATVVAIFTLGTRLVSLSCFDRSFSTHIFFSHSDEQAISPIEDVQENDLFLHLHLRAYRISFILSHSAAEKQLAAFAYPNSVLVPKRQE